MIDLSAFLAEPRVKLVAQLEPLAGTRFQPTGFPDLGAATYPSPTDGSTLLLVESAQSMANRLESQLWNGAANMPIELIRSLPYVRVLDPNGEYLTSSRTESHRLASPYVEEASFDGSKGYELIIGRLGIQAERPIDHGRVHRALFDLDPLCLVHGVWFADKRYPGAPKIARALTAFIEACGVQEAYSGGVKFDHVSNTGDEEKLKAGFANVPFPRTEFVAELIEASFVIDVSQIRRYALEQEERELLLALALLETRSLLDDGLRLRTACDLAVTEVSGDLPAGFDLPDRTTLERLVTERAGDPRPPLDGIFGG